MRQKIKFKNRCFLFFSCLFFIGAVMDIDTTERSFLAPGNGYSKKMIREIRGGKDEVITITIDRTFKEPVFKETSLTKEIGLKSKLLSDFYGRPIIMKAAMEKLGSDAEFVILPTGGHGDRVWKQVIKRIHQSMDERLLRRHPGLKPL